jgi:hypothetical protein
MRQVHVEKWENAIGLDSRVIRAKHFSNLKMHWKERSTLFCGQILELDVHLFEDGGSRW